MTRFVKQNFSITRYLVKSYSMQPKFRHPSKAGCQLVKSCTCCCRCCRGRGCCGGSSGGGCCSCCGCGSGGGARFHGRVVVIVRDTVLVFVPAHLFIWGLNTELLSVPKFTANLYFICSSIHYKYMLMQYRFALNFEALSST